jgi:hypothetical protein
MKDSSVTVQNMIDAAAILSIIDRKGMRHNQGMIISDPRIFILLQFLDSGNYYHLSAVGTVDI